MLLVPPSLNPSVICLQLLCDYLRTESGQPWLSGTELCRILLTHPKSAESCRAVLKQFLLYFSALWAETQRRAPGSRFFQFGAGWKLPGLGSKEKLVCIHLQNRVNPETLPALWPNTTIGNSSMAAEALWQPAPALSYTHGSKMARKRKQNISLSSLQK